ncbi:MAG: hypothetical protein ACT4OE_03100 [Sphingosinicella sp.]
MPLLVLASGCATATAGLRPAFRFDGPIEHLEQLALAARHCGLADTFVSFQAGGAPVLYLDLPRRRDRRFDCALAWLAEHPELGLLERE